MASWWLVYEDVAKGAAGSSALPVIALPEGIFTIGRDSSCSLILVGSRVSRRHAEIEVNGDEIILRDLKSRSGTLVDGQRTKEAELSVNSIIEIASTRLRLVTELPEPERSATKNEETTSSDDGSLSPFQAFLHTLAQSSDPKEVLERSLRGLVELISAERGFVLLEDEDSSRFIPVASIHLSDADEQSIISRTICRQAIKGKSTIVINNSAQDERCKEAASLAQAFKPRSVICSPLCFAGSTVGVIYLDMAARVGGVSEATSQLVNTVTGFAASILGTGRTRRKLLEAQRRVQAIGMMMGDEEKFIMGQGKASSELKSLIQAAAEQDITVLITGETGTGKEMVAKALHRLSKRRGNPFVPVNCAALARDIMEAELFGVKKGAFTGAEDDRVGRFELASGGTLFLDEVGDVPLDIQVKLLRVLQEQTVTRLGCTRARRLDFRLICATNVDIESKVRDGDFRQDFYYRINVFRLELPALRDRQEAIMPLAEHFLKVFTRRCQRNIKGFTEDAKALLLKYGWPGNIRELRNAIERAVVIERDEMITPNCLPVGSVIAPAKGSMQEFLDTLPIEYDAARDEFDRHFFKMHLEKSGGNQRAVSRDVKIARNTLARRLKKIGLIS